MTPLQRAVVRFVTAERKTSQRGALRADYVDRADAMFDLQIHAKFIEQGREWTGEAERAHIEAGVWPPDDLGL